MDPGFGQITHGLVVGGIGFPVLSGMLGAVVSVLTARAVRMMTVMRIVFLALGVAVVGGCDIRDDSGCRKWGVPGGPSGGLESSAGA
jgi:hypothetical protein